MSLNKHTREYDGGSPDLPLATGDVFRSHDLMRDLEYLQERAGRIAFDLFDLSAVLIKGGVVSKGTGDTLDITPAVAYIPHQVKTPDSYAGNPPTVKNEDSIRRVASTQQTNMAIAGATLDGSTPNYVKLRAKETDGSSRARLKGSGSYAYERVDSFEFVVTSVAGGTYDLVLATFTGNPSGAFTFSDQVLSAERSLRPQWTSPSQLGAKFTVTNMGDPAITALNETDIALFDAFNDELRTYRFNGGVWALVGSGLAISTAGNGALAALNDTDVAFIDATNADLRTYRFNGSIWAQVGNDLNIATMGEPALAALNSTDVAFVDATNDDLRTYRFDGTDWAQVGSDLNIATMGEPALAALNDTDVAFIDATNDELRTYRFNGGVWALVGSGLAISTSNPAITALNGMDIAFVDSDNDILRSYRFNGSTWSQIGSGISPGAVLFRSLAALNGTDVAFADSGNTELLTYRFGFSMPGMVPYHP